MQGSLYATVRVGPAPLPPPAQASLQLTKEFVSPGITPGRREEGRADHGEMARPTWNQKKKTKTPDSFPLL